MDLLNDYIDKAYITTILCDLSLNYYNTIYNISLAPTILGSSLLTILNSSEIPANPMKIINITLNGLNTIILALMSSYKINDRINNFKTLKIKFNKLTHILESLKNKNEEVDKQVINTLIEEYDKLYEDLIYPFPNHIRNRVIKSYGNYKKLPNSLDVDFNLTKSRAEIVNVNENINDKV